FAGSMRGVCGVRLLGRVLTGVLRLVGRRCRRSVSHGCGYKPVRGAPFAAATTTSASPAPSATPFAGLAAGLLALRLERQHLAGVFAFVYGVLGLCIRLGCVRRLLGFLDVHRGWLLRDRTRLFDGEDLLAL